MPQATHFPSKGRNESVSSGPRGPKTQRCSMGCREPGRTPQHPRAPQRMGPCGLNPSGMDGGVGKPQWHRGGRGLGIFLFFFFQEKHRATLASPPAAPISSLHLHSSGSQGFLASFPLRFLLVSTKLPLSEGWKASIIKGKEEKKNKEGKESIMHPSPCCPFPLPRWPHTTHPDFPSPSNAFEAGFSRPWISPTVPAWLQSPSCSEAI